MLLAMPLALHAAEPSIAVTATPRYPWSGMVDLAFTITGDSGVKFDTSFTAKDLVGGTNLAMKTIYKSNGSSAALTNALSAGSYKWTWNAAEDLPSGFVCERVTVVGEVIVKQGLYMVIDLSGGPIATKYPVSYLDDVPSGGWSDEYKTTKLVLRRIDPGSFMMQGTIPVKITKTFHIGIFEVTQRQFELVMNYVPSWMGRWKSGTFPVDYATWNAVRGWPASWPSTIDVDSDTFMGRLRARCGLLFDLPTEAQWEYACRAGTESSYNNGGDDEFDIAKVGRYFGNRKSTDPFGVDAPITVGSYASNAWGLYDMHGNEHERCLDWQGDIVGGEDPVGPTTGTCRVLRGGSWQNSAKDCTSSSRCGDGGDVSYEVGFRVCCGGF